MQISSVRDRALSSSGIEVIFRPVLPDSLNVIVILKRSLRAFEISCMTLSNEFRTMFDLV